MFGLWNFDGGIHLPAHKAESTLAPMQVAELPKELIYPLMMRNGEKAKPLVSTGEQVRRGQIVVGADGWMNPPLHAATSGKVRGIEQRLWPQPSSLVGDCIVIDVDGDDESVEFQGTANYASIQPGELLDKIHAAGIVGLGGAAFPTAVKLNPQPYAIDTLLLNGAECEPYITCDDSLLRHFPREVLGGAKLLMHILGVNRCLLAVGEDMQDAIIALEKAQSEGEYGNIHIIPVPAIYPTGGEKQLIKVLTGREVPAHGIPAQIGVICQNVATAAAIHKAITTGEPLISRIVTITGRGVLHPQNLLARIGTPVAELVEHCGGYTDSAERLIMGGPMMGFALPTDDLPITKATNCILVAGQGEVIHDKQAMPCIRCGACATACPVSLLPQQLYWHARADNLERVMDCHLPDCIECGCCDIVCPSHIPLVQYFRSAKSKVAAKERESLKADHARLRYEARQARKEREKLEKAESAKRKKALLYNTTKIQQKSEPVP